ncbi:MAG: RNA polymerase sigma factor [Prevotella sp.]|nr:RNA polymerase sigma factor [Prevotella sp.]
MAAKYNFHTDVLPLKNELFRMALRITQNSADAEDVVQDTMLRVWKRRDEWDGIESMEAFCLTICRNTALDRLRRMENHAQSLDATVVEPADYSHSANPEDMAVQGDRIALVRRLIGMLPEKQRSCMQLRDMEGKSYRDIATILGITEEQVKVNIFRARKAVKERFLKKDAFGV